jgi:phosphatidylserine/phosphatidylglycerophosphate/cardiolipin synthase-like enzyme
MSPKCLGSEKFRRYSLVRWPPSLYYRLVIAHHRTKRQLAALSAATLAALGAGCAASTAGTVHVLGSSAAGGGLALVTEPGTINSIYAAIEGAHASIDMTMYELDDPTAEHALIAAAGRGVTVRVLLSRGLDADLGAYAYLRTRGAQVRWSPPYFALTHQKTMTIDHRRSLVMTLNLTARYYASTRDFAIVDSRPPDVAAIESVFAADWNARMITPRVGSGDLLWSPGAQRPLIAVIEHAAKSLDVENEELADPPVLAALCRAAERGVRVRVVMTYRSEWASAFSRLTGCGAGVRVYRGETPLYIHAKAMIADGSTAYVGSQNLSYDSLERNRELGLMTASSPVVGSLSRTFAGDYRGASAVAP